MSFQHYVSSISPPQNEYLSTPRNWAQAVKSQYREEWLQGLFKHLNSCLNYGTYGLPQRPPKGVTILDTVLALRNKLDEYNRLDERKVRMCANGSQQSQGIDYDEAYAPAILSITIRVEIALCNHLGLPMWHIDVSNAFQSTPAPLAAGQVIYIRCFPEYLLWLETQHPELWIQIPPEKHEAEKVLVKELGLVPNRADPCFYSGIIEGEMVLVGRATDDLLIGGSEKVYRIIHDAMDKHWKIHDKGLAKFFFGNRITQTTDGTSMDQIPYAYQLIEQVFGKDWRKHTSQSPALKHSVPLPHGNEFEASLLNAIPLDARETKTMNNKYNFKYRSLLAGLMYLALFTRPDLLTACTRLARFQSAPAEVHYRALNKLMLYLRANPDKVLMYKRPPSVVRIFLQNIPIALRNAVTNNDHLNSGHHVSSLAQEERIGLEGAATGASSTDLMFEIQKSEALAMDEPISSSLDYDTDGIVPTEFTKTVKVPLVSTIDSRNPPNEPQGYACKPPLSGLQKQRYEQRRSTVVESESPICVTQPPPTEGDVDAGFGSIHDTHGHTGYNIMMGGTTIAYASKRQATMAYNTTESELYATNDVIKVLKWLRQLLADVGMPYHFAIPMGEDNEGTRFIAH